MEDLNPQCVLSSSWAFWKFQIASDWKISVFGVLICFQDIDTMSGSLHFFYQFATSGAESVCSLPAVLSEMLLLVSREVHQVPQQECLHYGELSRAASVASPGSPANVQHMSDCICALVLSFISPQTPFCVLVRLPFMGKTSASQPKMLLCFSWEI